MYHLFATIDHLGDTVHGHCELSNEMFSAPPSNRGS